MSFARHTIIAGLAAGVATAAWTLFEFAMGWHGPRQDIGATTGFIALIFPVLATAWAMRTAKREQQGRLTLGEAFRCGMGVATVVAVFGLVFYAAYYTVINPGFLAAQRATGADVELSSQLLTVGIGSLIFGAVVSLVLGVLLRSRGQA